MKIYSAQHRAIVEAPIMEKPDPQLYLTVKDYEVAMLTYEKRLTSYPPIPVLREHQNLFKDGQEVKEGIDYELEHPMLELPSWMWKPYDLNKVKEVAVPIKQQVSEEGEFRGSVAKAMRQLKGFGVSEEDKPVHELKTWPQYFQKVRSGEKTFEVRKDDRNYQVGDILHLKEWKPKVYSSVNPNVLEGEYTGEELKATITYILKVLPHESSLFGISSNTVVMSISAHQSSVSDEEDLEPQWVKDIEEQANNDYAMMQACDFAEWMNKNVVDYLLDANKFRHEGLEYTAQELYEGPFLHSQWERK